MSFLHTSFPSTTPSFFLQVIATRDSLPPSHRPPLLVKISPDLTEEGKEDIAAVLSRPHCAVDGLIVCNTTTSRPNSLRSSYKGERGGLSGQPVKNLSTELIRDMYALTGGVFVGGCVCTLYLFVLLSTHLCVHSDINFFISYSTVQLFCLFLHLYNYDSLPMYTH